MHFTPFFLQIDGNMSLVAPNLIVGSFEESFNQDFLNKNNVTHILNVATEMDVVERVNRFYLKCGVADDDPNCDISSIFTEAHAYITSAMADGRCVFVHCFQFV